MAKTFSLNKTSKYYAFIATGICAFSLVCAIIMKAWIYGVNFDEGYNLQIPLNLLHYGVYGTRHLNSFIVLDPFISTGPLLLVPVTVVWDLFGEGILQARFVSCMYALLVFLALWAIGRRLGHRWYGALALFLLILVKDMTYLFGAVLGEVSAICVFLWGVWFWDRAVEDNNWFFAVSAGLCWGMSVWAKSSMMMMIGFVSVALVTMWFIHCIDLRFAYISILVAFIVSLAWFALPLIVGSGCGGTIWGSREASGLLRQQLNPSWLENFIRNSPVLLKSMALPILLGCSWDLLGFLKRPSYSGSHPTTRLILDVIAVLWILWWWLFNGGAVYRHLFPGFAIGIAALTSVVFDLSHRQSCDARAVLGVIVILCLINLHIVAVDFFDFYHQIDEIRESKAAQFRFAHHVAQLEPKARIMGWKWFMAWDIAALSQRAFGDLAQIEVMEDHDVYLVITPTIKRFPAVYDEVIKIIEECSGEISYRENDLYQLYKLRAPCTINE